jgi:hypothetical protein
MKADGFVRRDRETIPIEDGFVGCLLNAETAGRRLLDRRLAGDDFPVRRKGTCYLY